MTQKAPSIMVFGTTSGAGKSFLATALCRWYARQGLRVLPFKAQNMSNNARVVAGLDGGMGEIGSAQYFQALAAGVEPDVRMNPVLLKPERDTASQFVLLGQVDAALTALPWRERSQAVWPTVERSLHELEQECDLLIIEGAGSPAEINLSANDFVNLRTAEAAQARCLLICDIDRGGAFAHLYGTHQLLDPAVRGLIKGFVLNKFRGDEKLLSPGPERLQQLTGVPTLAVLPMQREHGLPEEDSVFDDSRSGNGGLSIGIVVYPHISNLDEFQPLKNLPGIRLVWARSPADLDGVDWVILPGSKQTSSDLTWLRLQGFEPLLQHHVTAGKPLLAICGGLQRSRSVTTKPGVGMLCTLNYLRIEEGLLLPGPSPLPLLHWSRYKRVSAKSTLHPICVRLLRLRQMRPMRVLPTVTLKPSFALVGWHCGGKAMRVWING